MIDKVKFLHIMPRESTVFNTQIINMINNRNEFNTKDHAFIISKRDVYEFNKLNSNVYFEENIIENPKLFSKYAQICDFIILHSYTFSYKMLLLKKEILKKIIWVEWGDDLYQKKYSKQAFWKFPKKIIGNFLRYLQKVQRSNFYAIGIGPKYDAIEVKKNYKEKLKIVMAPYGYEKNNLENLMQNSIKLNNNNDSLKIMVGHCAYPFIEHLYILNKLLKYKDENIKISLVLSYGNEKYAQEVKEKAVALFGIDKIEIIDKFMTTKEYVQYLNSVDIAIINYKHQSGMSNFRLLLYLGKKLYLNDNGYLRLITKLENIEAYNISDIDEIEFDEFSKPLNNPQKGIECASFWQNEDNIVDMWKKTFDELEK